MGEVFAGRYELVDPIGHGGIGAVWRAWDHRRRRYVAAKVLQQSDAHTLLRFVREQAVRIDHPHVLAPASWAADDDKVLFTMDLVAGGSLGHLIGDYGPLPPRYVGILLDQLLSGLAAVHAEGIVHRDIKPANILLEATGTGRPHLRVSDFGIALRKGEPRLTEAERVMGTPGYFSPEQLLGAEPDFPADLFAAGLVALYLLEGQKPDAKALVEYFAEHGTPGAPEGVPEALWQVLAGLLQPDPRIRFRTATGARKALTAARELLPPQPMGTAGPAEPVEVFDQIGPPPAGFGPAGPDGPSRPSPPSAPTAPTAPSGSGSSAPPGDGPGGTAGKTGTGGAGHPGPTPAGMRGDGHAGNAEPGAPPPQSTAPSVPPVPTAPPVPPVPPVPVYAPAPGAPPAAAAAVSMSDTGSFPLTPPAGPVPSAPLPAAAAAPPYGPAPAGPGAAGHGPEAARPYTPTRSASERLPGPARPPGRTAARAHAAARRPGPPVVVAVPVLLLAALCLAVGIWALSAA